MASVRFERWCTRHHVQLDELDERLRCPTERGERVESFHVVDVVTGLPAAEVSVGGLECRWLAPYSAIFDGGDVRLAGRDAEGRLLRPDGCDPVLPVPDGGDGLAGRDAAGRRSSAGPAPMESPRAPLRRIA